MSEYGAQARGRDIPDHHNLGLPDKRTRFPTRTIESNKLLETGSRVSRHSRHGGNASSRTSTSNAARMKALAEAAAAKESAEIEKRMARRKGA